MSGGVGSRFWPLVKNKAQTVLDFFEREDRCYKVLSTDLKNCSIENIFIVTNDAYAEITRQQLPELSENQILGADEAEYGTLCCFCVLSDTSN